MADQFQPPTGGMVRCEVTGKIVPESETVVFQGKRVSMEGKERLVELLKSGEMLPGELEKPTVLRRFGAAFFDNIILQMIVGAFGAVAGIGGFFGGAGSLDDLSDVYMLQALIAIAGLVVYIGYFGLMHGIKGQSVGKMAGKLRVVMRDGSPVDMKTAFLRAFYYTGINIFLAVGFIVAAASEPNNAVTMTIIPQFIVGIYGIVNAGMALTDKAEQRALHDRLAGTRVIVDA